MNSNILRTIRDSGEKSLHELQRQHRIGVVSPDVEFDTELAEAQYHLLEVLKITGTEVFDDESQWNTYQGVLAALLQLDRLSGDRELQSLKGHKITKLAPRNYNPLGELDELANPTVEQLAKRYNAEEIIDDDWRDRPSMSLQEALAEALLNLTMGKFPAQRTVEIHLARAMILIDRHYMAETVLEVNEITKTYTAPNGGDVEYDTTKMEIKQRQGVDPEIFDTR
jgi:hypothetical protein